MVLGNSQVSNLLGLGDVIGVIPARLTSLDDLRGDDSVVKQQIRYGAIVVAFQQLAEASSETSEAAFIQKVAEQFSTDKGQFFFNASTDPRELTLAKIYQAAKDNIEAITPSLTNATIKSLAETVVSELSSNVDAANAEAADAKTSATPDDLNKLLSSDEITDLDTGLQKTKQFVNSLIDYEATFWEDGYKSELDAYGEMLKAIGDSNKENLNALAQDFADIQAYYVSCISTNGCDASNAMHNRNPSYNASSKTLTIDSGAISVSQRIADINLTDDIDKPTSSNAIDVLITGTLVKNSLTLKLAHDLNSDETEIDVPSSMRVYYDHKVTGIPTDPNTEIQGYEIIWGEFELYDSTTQNQVNETELAGAFRIFYRGLRDPEDSNSELRFNIAEVVLSSTISDQIDDDAGDDREFSRLVVTATANKANDFYPAQKLASFDGFFNPNNQYPVGHSESGFLSYELGTENVPFGGGNIEVEIADFIYKDDLAEDIRYRFYPDERVEDELDSDGDGDRKEIVDMHKVEECILASDGTVEKCNPKGRIFEKRDRQQTLNDLWEAGAFQLVEVEGRGTYHVDFDIEDDANSCKVLQPLQSSQTLDAELLTQQVLGLSAARAFVEVSLEDSNNVDLPRTLMDINIIAPSADKYRVLASLSHDYSNTATNNSGVVVGTGSNADVISVSYDTSNDFENTANLSITQGGVVFSLNDGSSVTEDGDITAFFSQTFNSDQSNDVHYKFVEDEEGQADRCVLTVGEVYNKTESLEESVYYLNYRGVVYGTARLEPVGAGGAKVLIIRYLDGSWLIPESKSEGSVRN